MTATTTLPFLHANRASLLRDSSQKHQYGDNTEKASTCSRFFCMHESTRRSNKSPKLEIVCPIVFEPLSTHTSAFLSSGLNRLIETV